MKNEFVLLLFVLFFSCKHDQEFITIFFKKIKIDVNNEALLIYKNQEVDSSDFRNLPFKDILIGAYYDSTNFQNWDEHFNKINFIESTEAKHYYLFYSFHYFLNNKIHSPSEIKKNVNEKFLFIENRIKKEYLKNKIEENKIAKINEESFEVGDSLIVVLPVEKINENLYTFYRQFPYTLNYISEEDSLIINGVLLEKNLNQNDALNRINASSTIFKVEIFSKSDSNIIIHNSINNEKELELHLHAYGRLLKKKAKRNFKRSQVGCG